MKLWSLACWLAGGAAMMWVKPVPSTDWTVIVTGDTKGYLSPCGCSDPMSGGIRRRASAIANLKTTANTLTLDNGGLVAGQTRQDELKVEALAEALKSMKVDAINLGAEEAKLGIGELLSIQMLSGNKLICTQLLEPSEAKVKAFIAKGPYLIGGVTLQPELVGAALNVKTISLDTAVTRLITEAAKKKLKPILLLQGPEDEAIRLAKKHTALVMIVHRSPGDPPTTMRTEGKTALITPAEFGKYVLTVKLKGSVASDYKSINLSPEFKDDPSVANLYKTYLMRVGEEKLLEQLPRQDTAEYAGSTTCKKCHGRAYAVWSESAHAKALDSLEKVGHDRDPDCVSCHVTGLGSNQGFKTRVENPELARVGCESCHGPQKAHSQDPHRVRPDTANQQKCASCHDTGHSPKFSRSDYWQKISHH